MFKAMADKQPYVILKAPTPELMSQIVNKAITMGYRPEGGMIAGIGLDEGSYLQPIVLK